MDFQIFLELAPHLASGVRPKNFSPIGALLDFQRFSDDPQNLQLDYLDNGCIEKIDRTPFQSFLGPSTRCENFSPIGRHFAKLEKLKKKLFVLCMDFQIFLELDPFWGPGVRPQIFSPIGVLQGPDVFLGVLIHFPEQLYDGKF